MTPGSWQHARPARATESSTSPAELTRPAHVGPSSAHGRTSRPRAARALSMPALQSSPGTPERQMSASPSVPQHSSAFVKDKLHGYELARTVAPLAKPSPSKEALGMVFDAISKYRAKKPVNKQSNEIASEGTPAPPAPTPASAGGSGNSGGGGGSAGSSGGGAGGSGEAERPDVDWGKATQAELKLAIEALGCEVPAKTPGVACLSSAWDSDPSRLCQRPCSSARYQA